MTWRTLGRSSILSRRNVDMGDLPMPRVWLPFRLVHGLQALASHPLYDFQIYDCWSVIEGHYLLLLGEKPSPRVRTCLKDPTQLSEQSY